jgi:MFS superfamily sulfate permease-like transporter
MEFLTSRQDSVKLLVFYLGAVPKVDLAGAELIAELRRTLQARGIELRLADAHGEVREALKRNGFEKDYGPLESGQTVDRVIAAWQAAADAGVSG